VTVAGNKDQGHGDFNAGGFNNDGGTGTFVYVTLARNSSTHPRATTSPTRSHAA
jgi:hypothetical protein